MTACMHSGLFIIIELLGAAVAGAIWQNVWVAVAVMLAMILTLWISATATAPIRQRNELRGHIQDFYEEMAHIRVVGIASHHDKGRTYVRAELKNDSKKHGAKIKVSLVSSTPPLSGIGFNADLPIVLSTKQRLERQRAGREIVPQRRFDMPPDETKHVELFHAQQGSSLTVKIEHENSEYEIRLAYDYLLEYEINGAGENVTFWVQLRIGPNGQWESFFVPDVNTLDKEALDVPWETPKS